MPVGQRGWSFVSTQHWWGHFWSAVSVAGLLSAKKIWSLWKECSKWPWKRLRDWSIFCKRRGWESWNCLDQRVQIPNLGEDKRRWRQNLFTGVQWQDKSQGHKLQCRKFHLNAWKISRKNYFFYCEYNQTLEQVGRRGCWGSPCLETVKIWCSTVWTTCSRLSHFEQGWLWKIWSPEALSMSRGDCGQHDLQRPFLSSAMIWFCEDIDKVDAQWKLLSLHYYFLCGWCRQELQDYFEESHKISFEQPERQKS